MNYAAALFNRPLRSLSIRKDGTYKASGKMTARQVAAIRAANVAIRTGK